jgi:hypothetical protein
MGAGGWAIVAIIALVLLAGGARTWWRARRRREARDRRDAEARTAAAQAVEDDAAFDADALTTTAEALLLDVQAAWDGRDEAALRRLIGGDLLTEWLRRLADFGAKRWHNRVRVTGEPQVRLITLVNRREDAGDRVVVHVQVDMDSWVETPKGRRYPDGQDDASMTLSEYWTLAKHGATWQLVSIEGEDEGDHHLTSAMVLDPSDDPDLAAATRTELAVGDAAAESVVGLVSTGLRDDAGAPRSTSRSSTTAGAPTSCGSRWTARSRRGRARSTGPTPTWSAWPPPTPWRDSCTDRTRRAAPAPSSAGRGWRRRRSPGSRTTARVAR